MEAPGNLEFWNQAARTRQSTHLLDHERLTRALPRHAHMLDYGSTPADGAQKKLLREFKRTLRPGGLLPVSDSAKRRAKSGALPT